MSIEQIERQFLDQVSNEVRLQAEGTDKYRVFTPFRYEDGDHIVIVLKRGLNGEWLLTDNGHTYMHLSYDIDEESLRSGTRQEIITKTLSEFFVNDIEGELVVNIKEQQFGNALYDFVQGILRISDVSYLSRERVKSTFKVEIPM